MRLRSFATLVALILLAVSRHADASVVLTVDVSDPGMVSIQSTSAFSAVDATGLSFSDGVSLVGLLGTGTVAANESRVSGDLAVGVSQIQLGVQFVDASNGLFNLFGGPDTTIEFSTNEPAFTGQGLFNLSQQPLGALPPLGQTGDVVLGFNATFDTVIGTYVVVPEPTSLAFAGFGMLLLRRRR
ncbi:MAG: hypothetical protein AAGI46_01295 [Planctomycetota bacterium]